jgi:thiosulfate/3-mercaptopyruvate sulfurtransferase
MTGPIIGADSLAELIAGPGEAPTILDVRWQLGTGADRRAYLAGHIPGAVFIDLDEELADRPGTGGRHPLPSPERFSDAMQAAGVCAERPVVVYDAAPSTSAARAWWLLRYYGHPEVAVLDGGLAAWTAAGNPVQTNAPALARGDFVAKPGGMPTLSADGALELAARGVLIDARAPERFAGLTEPIDPVAGHIPGARNRPTTENLDASGGFLAPALLSKAFERLGVREDTPVAAYCGSGVTAAHEVLALELAGFRAALYPGSWSEWITDPRRPVARDPGPADA